MSRGNLGGHMILTHTFIKLLQGKKLGFVGWIELDKCRVAGWVLLLFTDDK